MTQVGEGAVPSAARRPSWPDGGSLERKSAVVKSGWLVTLGLAYQSVGVIYGDIGTSPLYTVSSIMANVEEPTEEELKMAISMIFWTLTLVVLIKYVLVVMHANDKGEGGTFALYTRLCRTLGVSPFGTLQRPEHAHLVSIASKVNHHAREGMQIKGHRMRSLDLKSIASPPLATRTSSYGQGAMEPSPSLTPPPDTVAPATPLRTRWWNIGAVPSEPIRRWFRNSWWAQRSLLCVAIIATSMVFGDGVLTPAVSVVSAVSGLSVATENVTQDIIIGVSCAIIILLFSAQFKGTHRVSALFSPVVLLWLGCNCAIGIYNLANFSPSILEALSPHWIGKFFQHFGVEGWRMLGAVMLSVTGVEAMFADLGHFDVPSVSLSWACYAYPCLVFTYLGQGAYLVENPGDTATVYWSNVPTKVFWPMLVLATLASVVASQALISACFSICNQAKALGFLPRVKIVHTSTKHTGQIYISSVNWLLMVLTIAVIAGFKANSTQMGNAYGLTISAVMLVTTLLTSLVMIVAWDIALPLVLLFCGAFAVVDGAFVSANLTKVPHGGWVAIAITFGVATMFFVWWAGQRRRMRAATSCFHPQDLFTFTTENAKVPFKANVDSTAGIGFVDKTRPGHAMAEAHRLAITSAWLLDDESDHDPCSSSAGGEWFSPDGGHSPMVHGSSRPVAESEEDAAHVTTHAMRAPSREELGLLRGELNLALRIPGLTGKPLATLPGIALFYSDHADTVPPVMCHFLRNVEAVHEINIFVCVRHMAIPFIDDSDRLLVRPVPGLPSFYQALARYGYMDTVDHGKDFVNWLITSVVHVLEDRSGLRRTPNLIHAVTDPAFSTSMGYAGPVAEGLMDLSSPSLVYTEAVDPHNRAHSAGRTLVAASMPPQASAPAPPGPGRRSVELSEITVNNLANDSRPTLQHASSTAQMLFRPPRMAMDLASLSKVIAASSIGHAISQTLPPSAGPTSPKGPSGYDQLMSMAQAINDHGADMSPVLEDSARRVAAMIQAASSGVVYYFGRTSLRMQENSNVVHDFVFDTLYKPMLLLSYAEHEAWRVPVENLVELGMVVYI